MQTVLGRGIVLNKQSSLPREWITFHDTALPADLVGTIGVKTAYKSESYSGNYIYEADYHVATKESLSAIEIRFLAFDVWGKPTRTLSATYVQDMPANSTQSFSSKWNILTENEAEEYYASIAFIAQVRTTSGRVVQMDITPVLEEARKLYSKFTAEDLEPNPIKK